MKIISDISEVSKFLGNFSVSLSADPASWEGWHAIVVCAETEKSQSHDPSMMHEIAQTTREVLRNHDGIILHLGKNTILVVTQNIKEGMPLHLQRSIDAWAAGRWSILTCRGFVVLDDIETIDEYARLHASSYDRMQNIDHVEFDMLKAMVPHISDLLKAWMTTHKKRVQHDKPHVLVVDDDPLTRHIISRALKDHYPMTTASSVPEAIEKHLLMTPDIVFLDIDMPECDGFTLLNYIRSYDPACRVVMFSSNSYVDNRVKAFAAGAIGFAEKPFNRASFERYINLCKPNYKSTN